MELQRYVNNNDDDIVFWICAVMDLAVSCYGSEVRLSSCGMDIVFCVLGKPATACGCACVCVCVCTSLRVRMCASAFACVHVCV